MQSSIGLSARLATILLVGPNIGPALVTPVSGQINDYTCYPKTDYGVGATCPTINDGVCDNPNLGGKGGNGCLNQDCLDCNYHCK